MSEFGILGILAGLILCICIIASIRQAGRYASIKERELRYRHILVSNEKITPPQFCGQAFTLVTGSVVISIDLVRATLSVYKAIFGGRLGYLQREQEYGRREAILRMKKEAERMGAKTIYNVRLETSVISFSGGWGNGGLFCAEILAYGTAWKTPGVTGDMVVPANF